MQEKINAAIAYCRMHGFDTDTRNDASNIYAESYDEYMIIWDALATI